MHFCGVFNKCSRESITESFIAFFTKIFAGKWGFFVHLNLHMYGKWETFSYILLLAYRLLAYSQLSNVASSSTHCWYAWMYFLWFEYLKWLLSCLEVFVIKFSFAHGIHRTEFTLASLLIKWPLPSAIKFFFLSRSLNTSSLCFASLDSTRLLFYENFTFETKNILLIHKNWF